MERKQISSHEAQEYARKRGFFARVGVGGFALIFYTGEEISPGTWLEAGRTGMTNAGIVDFNSIERICS